MSQAAGSRGEVSTASAVLTWAALVLGAASLVTAVVIDWVDGKHADALMFVPFCTAFAVVGAAIVLGGSRRMGALFVFAGVEVSVCLLLSSYTDFAIAHGLPGAAWSGAAFVVSIWPGFSVALILQLFPDGRALTPRWRPLVVVTIAVGVVGMLASGLSAEEDFTSNFPTLRHPVDVLPEVVGNALYSVSQLALLATVVASAGVVALRYRRSRGVERQQMRWLVAAGAVAAAGFVVTGLFTPWGIETVVAWATLMPLVPVACGFAILRYRLYDIDRIISRTLAYALVTGALLVVYGVVVTSVTRLLPGTSSSFAVAAATLAAAAAFRPVLVRVQAMIDRRFNRAQYDAQQTVDAFAGRLRDEVDAGVASSDLVSVLDRALQPVRVGLWMRDSA